MPDAEPEKMTHRACFSIFVLIATSGFSIAAEWTTEDSRLSVDVPDAARFSEMEPPPSPFKVIWVSHDGTTRLGVTATPVPPKTELLRRSVEEGLSEAVGGEIIDSAAAEMAGRPVYKMTARAKDGVMHISQSLVAIEDTVYKVMAVTTGGPTAKDPDAPAFLASTRINVGSGDVERSRESVPSELSDPVQRPITNRQIDTHQLSKTLGGLGLLGLLIGLGALWYRRRGTKRTDAPPRTGE